MRYYTEEMEKRAANGESVPSPAEGPGCCRVVIGALFIVIALVMLALIEASYLINEDDFDSTKDAVVEITNLSQELPADQLVYLSGNLTSGSENTTALTDTTFNITVGEEAILFWRNVEVYQWIEENYDDSLEASGERRQLRRGGGGGGGFSSGGSRGSSSSGGSRGSRPGGFSSYSGSGRYYYYPGWYSGVRPSSSFRGDVDVENPESALFPVEYQARSPLLLDDELELSGLPFEKFYWWSFVSPLDVATIPENTTASDGVQLVDSVYYYYGDNVTNATIGHTRVSFGYILPGDISILAKWNGTAFEPYVSNKGRTIFYFDNVVRSVDQILEQLEDDEELPLPLPASRFVSFVLILVGCGWMKKSIFYRAGLDVDSRSTTHLVFFYVAAIAVTIFLMCLAMGLVWIGFRPEIGAIFLGIVVVMLAALGCWGARFYHFKNQSNHDDSGFGVALPAEAAPYDLEDETPQDTLEGTLPEPSTNAAAYLEQQDQEATSKM